jgi:hypothetical protein
MIEDVSQPIGNAEAQWLANATQYYHSFNEKFPVIDTNQVGRNLILKSNILSYLRMYRRLYVQRSGLR